MNIENLAKCLKPWVQVSTWNTHHPLDEERFHKAVKSAIDSHPETCISYESYKEAIEYLVNELYFEKYESEFIEDIIKRYSEKANSISSYVFDVKNI